MRTKIILSATALALTIASTTVKAQTNWLLAGNPLNSTTQFLGSTTPFDLYFKANNIEQMRISQSAGSVTIARNGVNLNPTFAKLIVNPALTQNNTADNLVGLSIEKQLNSTGGSARRIFFVPHLLSGSYNGLPENNDCGIFWSDASNGVAGTGGRNLAAGLIIAPFAGSTAGIRITADGNVGIGVKLTSTTNPNNYKLAVNGTIGAKAVKIEISSNTWADYVFNREYKLRTLPELEAFVKANNHLPNIPSATEVEKNGIDIATMDAKLLEKIEELSLYIIEQNKQLTEQNKRIELLEQKVVGKK
jgi:hypothetical protein